MAVTDRARVTDAAQPASQTAWPLQPFHGRYTAVTWRDARAWCVVQVPPATSHLPAGRCTGAAPAAEPMGIGCPRPIQETSRRRIRRRARWCHRICRHSPPSCRIFDSKLTYQVRPTKSDWSSYGHIKHQCLSYIMAGGLQELAHHAPLPCAI